MTKRMSWNELKDVVHRGKTSDEEAFGVLGRTEQGLSVYRAQRTKILETYATTTDELRFRLFGAPVVANIDGKMAVAAADPTAIKCYVLVRLNGIRDVPLKTWRHPTTSCHEICFCR